MTSKAARSRSESLRRCLLLEYRVCTVVTVDLDYLLFFAYLC